MENKVQPLDKWYEVYRFFFYFLSVTGFVGIFAYCVHLTFSWFPYVIVTLLVSVPVAWGITWFAYSVDKEANEALRLDAESEQRLKLIRAQKEQERQAQKALRFPRSGRRREDFPIIGPSWFCNLINRMLDQMESNAPEHYREAIEYLEKAEYHLFGNGYVARCDGLFSFSEDLSYHYMLWVFLHEVGHRVNGLNSNNWSEDAANSYAEAVIRKVEQ